MSLITRIAGKVSEARRGLAGVPAPRPRPAPVISVRPLDPPGSPGAGDPFDDSAPGWSDARPYWWQK